VLKLLLFYPSKLSICTFKLRRFTKSII